MLDRVETELARRLKARIRGEGPLTFRDFMHAALYDPEHGFYAKGPAIGDADAGAFSTSAKFPAFGFAIARAVEEADRRAGEPLRVVELGGGTGDLARNVLRFLEDEREYVTVDASAGLRAKQGAAGARAVASLADVEPAPSFVIGNEVLDALPVHRVLAGPDEGILEVHVGLNKRGDFIERLLPPSTPALARRLERVGVRLQKGQFAEIALDVPDFVRDAARVIERGYLVLIDYGDDARDLYDPAKPGGTLRAYRRQGPAYDVFDHVGDTDLTADVDFTTVDHAARAAGLEDAGRAPQGPWLLSAGIRAFAEAASDEAGARARMEEVTQLTDPSMLGNRFTVACYRTPGLPDAPGFVWE